MPPVRNIAVLGMGVIGTGWMTLFALKGYSVAAYSRSKETRERGLHSVKSNLDFLTGKGLISPEQGTQAIERIRVVDELSRAVTDADFIEECTGETYEIKHRIFNEISSCTPPHAIAASSTSGLSITEIQKHAANRENLIITHPFNPPHLIPLVEIVPGEYTSDNTFNTTLKLMEDLGKIPVVVRKEVSGFIANRLAAALWREAVDLVDKGVASVEDIDKALYAGPGIRWALMGQHLIYHLGGGETGGIEHFIDGIANTTFHEIWKDLAAWDYISEPVKAKLAAGIQEELRDRSFHDIIGWRDDKVVELLKIIYG